MRCILLILPLVLSVHASVFAESSAESATYCDQLATMGLEGRFLTVNPVGGARRNFIHGNLISVTSDMLVVQLGDSRSFINCAHIHSVDLNQDDDTTPPGELLQ